jgi:hypothetical protein
MAKIQKSIESTGRTESMKMIGDLPMPTVERIPLGRLFSARNVREKVDLTTDKGLELLQSLSVNGQMGGHFLIVSVQAKANPDGTDVITLVGNRRLAAMQALDNPTVLEATLSGVDPKKRINIQAKPGQFAEVECLAYRGLTEEQEAHIRADHQGIESLTKWDKYLQVIQLWEAGLNSRQIESMTGISHGVAERYRYIYEMDARMEQEWYDQCHGGKGKGLTFTDRNEIHKQWIQDVASSLRNIAVSARDNTSKTEYADSNLFKKFGPLSEAKYDEIVAAKQKPSEPEETEKARRSSKQHADNAFNFKDAPFTAGYAKWASGDPSVDLNALYQAELRFIREHKTLLAVHEELAEKFGELKARNDELVMENEVLKEELAKFKAKGLPAPESGTSDNPIEVHVS